MITFNVIDRVFYIKYNNSLGTCFTVDVDKKQYIVTARHILKNLSGDDQIEIFHGKTWKTLFVRLVGHSKSEIDISVLTTDIQLSPDYPLEPTIANLFYGQDVYFLGYPYGFSIDYGDFSRHLPVPFVKKAVVSCLFKENNIIRVYLDGHNNPGFFGGPVVFSGPSNKDYKVAGVISGYRVVHEPIYQGEKKLDLTYEYNTGIILAYGIKHAVDLIKENPVGFPLPEEK